MYSANLDNALALGANAVVNASSNIRLGNASVTVIEGREVYSFPSDGRFKTRINETVKCLDFITRLRPVEYHFQSERQEAFTNGSEWPVANKSNRLDQIRQSGFKDREVV